MALNPGRKLKLYLFVIFTSLTFLPISHPFYLFRSNWYRVFGGGEKKKNPNQSCKQRNLRFSPDSASRCLFFLSPFLSLKSFSVLFLPPSLKPDQEPKLVIYIGLNYEKAVFEVFEYDINLPLVLDRIRERNQPWLTVWKTSLLAFLIWEGRIKRL